MSLDMIAFVIFAATIVERLIELVVSRRNAAWSLARGGVEFGAGHFKWMVVMHTAFLFSMVTEFVFQGSSLPDEVRIWAIILAILCQVMRWWIIRSLGYQWNTRVIVVPGMPRVISGPYQFVNHPNYIVVALETAVLPLIFSSWRTALVFSVLNALMMRVRIRVENDALRGLQ